MPDPSAVFGSQLANQTPTPIIGRLGQGQAPVCYSRPFLSGAVTAPAAVTCNVGIWDDTVNTPVNLYAHRYDWYHSLAATPLETVSMGAGALATPNVSPATTTGTRVSCRVSSVNQLTGQSFYVWTAPVIVT